MNRRSLSLAVACLCAGVLPLSLMAQTMGGMPFTYVPISTGGTVPVICANADPVYFTDDNNGGDNFLSPYTNQNHTITLCPDESDASLALDFLVFSLATGQSAIDNDVLYIYDGEDVDAPLLASGQENQFEGVTVTASDANISGCITMEFVVNSGAVGANPGWVALVTCATSCAHPTASIAVSSPASISGNSGAVGLCIEESVTMDASGSMPGMSGAALESLIWNWGDGTTESVSVLEGFEQTAAPHRVSLVEPVCSTSTSKGSTKPETPLLNQLDSLMALQSRACHGHFSPRLVCQKTQHCRTSLASYFPQRLWSMRLRLDKPSRTAANWRRSQRTCSTNMSVI